MTPLLLALSAFFLTWVPNSAWADSLAMNSPLDWIRAGGYVMYPLLLFSVIGFAITLERWNHLKQNKVLPIGLKDQISALWNQGDFEAVKVLCQQSLSPLARILAPILEAPPADREDLDRSVEKNGQLQAQFLTKNLRILGAIASIAPMLGLLGTVIGMIKAFNVVAQGNPDLVAKSIAEALITTAVGLVIGIIALITYHYFRSKAERLALEMETYLADLFHTRSPLNSNVNS